MPRGRIATSCLAAAAAVGVTACGATRSGPPSALVRGSGRALPIGIVHTSLGPAAFATVTIHGRPYVFKLDTGAATTVLAGSLARTLGLPSRGASYATSTFGCTARTQPVGIADWRIGAVRLPAMTVATVASGVLGTTRGGVTFGGLLGSDVLSRFGAVTIRFAHAQLVLGGRPAGADRTIPLTVQRRRHGVIGLVSAEIGGRQGRYVLDTGAPTVALTPAATARFGLKPVGPGGTAYGAAGCAATFTPVRIGRWSAAGVALPATMAISAQRTFIRAPDARQGIEGVIGASVLAGLGEVTIDYAAGRLDVAPAG